MLHIEGSDSDPIRYIYTLSQHH